MPARSKAPKPVDPDALKRERAGTYRTSDGRFTIEGSSSGWLLLDADQADDLGLPLARGPFASLDAAKAAVGPARSDPAPISDIGSRTIRKRDRSKRNAEAGVRDANVEDDADHGAGANPQGAGSLLTRSAKPPLKPPRKAPPRPKPGVIIREMRTADGDVLRALWADAGFGSLGDDDRSLGRLARRNPGLLLVAADGSRVVGSALGAWDGRRGWIYHVAVAATHRRQGIAKRLVAEVEAGLRALGAPKINVLVRDDSDGGPDLWRALRYEEGASKLFGRKLEEEQP